MDRRRESRAHTGRSRNELARRAILDAAADLLASAELADVTIGRIADAAGVGRQTIYRWWPSKGAVLAEAMAERADAAVDIRPTGDLVVDLERFITATFAAVDDPAVGRTLRSILGQAMVDPPAAELLADFTARRRAQLRALLHAARRTDEPGPAVDPDLLADQIYGVLWYRLVVLRAPVDADLARRLHRALVRQLGG
ncbi:TetR/AcrR family transcriptional regulator C-terminal ligand-binding domain-containing protein [Pseudonocardia sp. CA-107938]|uniref:TetR/AcrR family transcriptional regulator n=1 Tax=Pseudonocardia sp. CA-107938 TaxID=3240021 RepID=UPI003D9320DC